MSARVRECWRRLRAVVSRRWSACSAYLTPGRARARAIRRAVWFGFVLLGAWIGVEDLNLGYGAVGNALGGIAVALLILLISALAVGIGRVVFILIPRHWTWWGLAGAFGLVALMTLFALPPELAAATGLALALAVVLAGAGIALARARPRRPVAAVFALVPALMLIAGPGVWLFLFTDVEDPVADLLREPAGDGAEYANLLENGPYRVGYLTYGSGTDRRRPEYADRVAWTSEPVDGRVMLAKPEGWRIRLRERWWGFGLDELPLNGRVWYPADADDDLPLVLVVHGNHDMMHFSDPGYAWLGQHLASRGHIVVSVDENFLNGSLFGGLKRENATRGWLLLEHLKAWRAWRWDPSHPLQARADTSRVVLIGHSRGGEAVALAAAFNRLPHFPENARESFDFGFGIRGVVAIAPVDGQFRPSAKRTRLDGVSYFVLHGGHDADVHLFVGDRQYVRTRPDPEASHFRASLYLHHANHGQFNSVWGDSDFGGPARYLLNRRGLMEGAAQRRAGLLYITAFAEAILGETDAMPALFCDAGLAGTLLPPTLYVNRCDDGRRVVLADFERRLDARTGSRPGVRLEGRDLALWREYDVGLRGRSMRQQTGAWLGWRENAEGEPGFLVHLDAVADLGLNGDSVLWLDLAQADRDPPKEDEAVENGEADSANEDDKKSAERDPNDLRPPLAIRVELEDAAGVKASRPLADFHELKPPLPARKTRVGLIDRRHYKSPTEPLLQSVSVPLAAFVGEGFDAGELKSIGLSFDTANAGVLIIERIAIEP